MSTFCCTCAHYATLLCLLLRLRTCWMLRYCTFSCSHAWWLGGGWGSEWISFMIGECYSQRPGASHMRGNKVKQVSPNGDVKKNQKMWRKSGSVLVTCSGLTPAPSMPAGGCWNIMFLLNCQFAKNKSSRLNSLFWKYAGTWQWRGGCLAKIWKSAAKRAGAVVSVMLWDALCWEYSNSHKILQSTLEVTHITTKKHVKSMGITYDTSWSDWTYTTCIKL